MSQPRFEPSAEVLDWATYQKAIISKGRLVSSKGLVAEIGEVGASLISLRLPDTDGKVAGGGDSSTRLAARICMAGWRTTHECERCARNV